MRWRLEAGSIDVQIEEGREGKGQLSGRDSLKVVPALPRRRGGVGGRVFVLPGFAHLVDTPPTQDGAGWVGRFSYKQAGAKAC
jgi:hypothetical protein